MFRDIPYEPIRIMGVDPGTDTYGISEVIIGEDKQIHVLNAYTLSGMKRLQQDGWLKSLLLGHGSRLLRIQWLAEETVDEVERFKPHRVFYESPFFSRKFVGSFEALVQCMTAVQCTMLRVFPFLPVEKISPQEGKAVVAVTGKGSQKEVVADRLKLLDGVTFHIDVSVLDEHSVDAIVIAIAGIRQLDLW